MRINPELKKLGNTKQLEKWGHIVALTIIILLAIWVSVLNFHDTYDDAYITFRYAHNLASGKGFVYNEGEQFLGITAPFYGFLLGILGMPFPDTIPEISAALSSLGLLATGLGLYYLGRLHQKSYVGFLAGLFFVINPLLTHTFGGEMLFLIALVIWAFVTYQMRKLAITAGLLAVAVMSRPDAVLVIIVLGIYHLLKTRQIPLKEILIGLGVLAPFVMLAWIYYGAPLPGTLDSRLAQKETGIWPPFSKGVYEWIKAFTVGNSKIYRTLQPFPDMLRYWLIALVGIPGLFLYPFWLLPLSWIALYSLLYHFLGVPFYHWYVVPIALALSILTASGVAIFVEGLKVLVKKIPSAVLRVWMVPIVYILPLIILTPGIFAQLSHLETITDQQPDAAEQIYTQTGLWLQENTPADASIGYLEIGYVGYHAQRKLIDPLGLVQNDVAPQVAKSNFLWAYQHYQPDFIVYNPKFKGFNQGLLEEDWFKSHYVRIHVLEHEDYGELIIYQRVKE